MQVSQVIDLKKETTPKICKLSADDIEKKKLRFWAVAKSIIPDFKIDESNKQTIVNLFNYFNGIEGKLDLNKGLWLSGDIGTGKSSLMLVFSEYLKLEYKGFRIHICSKISNDYAINGANNLDVYTYNSTGYLGEPVAMCFDELGREALPANHFGQKLNVMQHILHVRYSLWQSSGLKTFVTTNSDAKEIDILYDDFIRDRVREMFNIVLMQGKTRRK